MTFSVFRSVYVNTLYLLTCVPAWERVTGVLPGARPGEGVQWRVPGPLALAHGAWPGAACRSCMVTVGPPPAGGGVRVGCIVCLIAVKGRALMDQSLLLRHTTSPL